MEGAMKLHIASLPLLCMALLAVPAMAGNPPFYDNGPINGNTDAWTINFGFEVSDTFTVPAGGTQLTGIAFGAWLFPGDSIPSLSVQVGTGPFGTNEMSLDGVPTLQLGDCATNNFGFDVCTLSASWPGLSLAGGTYWITLDNAAVTSGDPVYWDENSGAGCGGAGCPSSAQENSVGTIPSEAFTLSGCGGCGCLGAPACAVPEPSSIMLLGSGIVGLAGVLRRKLF